MRSAEGRLQNKLNEEVTFLLGVDFEVPPINQRDSMKFVHEEFVKLMHEETLEPPPSPGSLPRGELILEPSGGFVPTPLACRRLVGTKFPSGLSTWSPLRVGGLEPLVGPWTSQARG